MYIYIYIYTRRACPLQLLPGGQLAGEVDVLALQHEVLSCKRRRSGFEDRSTGWFGHAKN